MTNETNGNIEEVPVLIVGASLVGLTLASLLAKYGIKCLAVEKHSSTAIYPKATVMMPRSMQVFKELGLYDTMLTESLKYYDEKTCAVTIESLKGKLMNVWMRDVNDGIEQLSPTRRVFLTQQALEPLLRSKAKELGAELRFSTELLAFDQSEDGVMATVKDKSSDRTYLIRSQYMIACDGFRSGIRTKLGIQMSGPGLLSRALTIYFEILDKEKLAQLPNAHYAGIVYVANEAVRAFFRFDRDKKESFLVINSAGPEGTEGSRFPADTASEEKCAEYLKAAIGDDDIAFKIHSWSTWEAVAAYPDRIREGRVFLAGDAAHQMPPSGGFGGNTGIQDAHNLAFKLAHVLRNQAGPGLLDTYEEERLPLARLTVLNAFAHYVHRMEPGMASLLEKYDVQEVPVEWLELAYRYRSKAIFTDDQKPLVGREIVEDPATALAKPGSVAHHVLVGADGVALSGFFGECFVLLVNTGCAEKWTVNNELPVKIVEFDFERSSVFRQRYGVSTEGAVLVRPDGFVAWSLPSAAGKSDEECREVLSEVLKHVLCF